MSEICFQTHEETREKNWVIQVRIEQSFFVAIELKVVWHTKQKSIFFQLWKNLREILDR